MKVVLQISCSGDSPLLCRPDKRRTAIATWVLPDPHLDGIWAGARRRLRGRGRCIHAVHHLVQILQDGLARGAARELGVAVHDVELDLLIIPDARVCALKATERVFINCCSKDFAEDDWVHELASLHLELTALLLEHGK